MKYKIERNKLFFFFLMVLLIASSMNVSATESEGRERITKSYTYSTSNEKETHDEKFADEISEKGKKYKLQIINYEILKKEPLITEKKVEKVIESDVIPEGIDYEPKQTITEGGIIYTYVRKTSVDDNTNLQDVTGYYDYDHEVTVNDVPATKEFPVSYNGETYNVSCNLTGIERLSTGTWVNTYIYITFVSYDSDTFEWQGYEIQKNESYPLQGYENELLVSVGANPGNYKVKNISWNGNAYYNNGVLCRDAVASVQRYVRYYRANYRGTFDPGTKYRVVYQGTEQIESDTDFNYEIKATAEYVRSFPVAYAVGIGIILLIILIVLILYLLSRKKKKNETK